MIRIRITRSPRSCIEYFLGEASLLPRERQGVWHGSLCSGLGVKAGSAVDPVALAVILDGFTARGSDFVERSRKDRRCAYDVVVSASKSVSLVAMCSRRYGAIVREAFAGSVGTLVDVSERLARRQGTNEVRVRTKNLAAACFTHEASRYGDPHLHAHLLTPNVTDNFGTLRALAMDGVYQNHMILDGIFQRELAGRLDAAGLAVSLTDGVAQLPVSEALCRQFSKGHSAIEAVVDRLGPRVSESRRPVLENMINDRVRPAKSRSRSAKAFQGMIDEGEFTGVEGRGSLVRRRWEDLELWRWMRRELRRSGVGEERDRWNVAYRASLRDVDRPIADFLGRALDPRLLVDVAVRGGECARVSLPCVRAAYQEGLACAVQHQVRMAGPAL